jgi:hypothetical protein
MMSFFFTKVFTIDPTPPSTPKQGIVCPPIWSNSSLTKPTTTNVDILKNFSSVPQGLDHFVSHSTLARSRVAYKKCRRGQPLLGVEVFCEAAPEEPFAGIQSDDPDQIGPGSPS